MIGIAAYACSRAATAPGARRRHGTVALRPHGGFPHDAHRVGQAARGKALAKLRRRAVAGVGDHRRPGQVGGQQVIDLRQGQFQLGLETKFVGDGGVHDRRSKPWAGRADKRRARSSKG